MQSSRIGMFKTARPTAITDFVVGVCCNITALFRIGKHATEGFPLELEKARSIQRSTAPSFQLTFSGRNLPRSAGSQRIQFSIADLFGGATVERWQNMRVLKVLEALLYTTYPNAIRLYRRMRNCEA